MDKNIAPDWALELTAFSAILFCITGFFGNLLTILALPYTRKLRNAATWFVVNLAVIEMVFCITILPMTAAHLIYMKLYKEHLLDDKACKFFVFLRYMIVQAELLSIAAIAVNRCILISIPKLYPRIFTLKQSMIMIVGIWGYSCLLMICPLTEVFGSFAYNINTQECDFDEGETLARKVFLGLGFLFPCIVVVVSYSYIFYKSRQSTRRLLKAAAKSGIVEMTRPEEGLRNREMRIARTIGVIFLAFIICCSPVTVAHFYGSQGQIPTLLLLLHPLYWAQYCLNLIVYVLMNRQYREAYITYISHWWPKFTTIIEKLQLPRKDEETSMTQQTNRTNSIRKIQFGRTNN